MQLYNKLPLLYIACFFKSGDINKCQQLNLGTGVMVLGRGNRILFQDQSSSIDTELQKSVSVRLNSSLYVNIY